MTHNPKDAPAAEDDDEVDLFGSDEEEEDPEVVAEREKRLAEYKKKKEGKTKPAAKSLVTLDVKPWDDETDMNELVKNVLAIEKDGLVWGAHKLQAVGFGIKKLQINLVVEDEKVSLDELQQQIEEDEDHVQSTDVVAMQASIPFSERLSRVLTICRNSKGSRHDLRMSVSHCVEIPNICCRRSLALAISSLPSLIDDEHYDHKNAK